MPPKRLDPRELFGSTRLIVVAGKGGVGKTTVTAVLARAAARDGRRVLTVELDGKPTLAALTPGIDHLSLSGSVALADYLDTHGLGRVTKRLRTSGVIEVVATAAPGIDDIVVLGKLKQLERSDEHDLVIVDGPAAGHAISMLLAPESLASTVRMGPIHTQALEVLEMLHDPARCQVVLVTLPETTPVNEMVETAYALEEHIGAQLGPVVVNAVDASPEMVIGAKTDPALAEAARFRNARRALHRRELERLHDQLAMDQLVLPQVVAPALTADDVDRLAEHLLAGGAA